MPDLIPPALAQDQIERAKAEMEAHARLGIECEAFLRSPVHAWLLAQAEAEAASAVMGLRTCPPTDHAQIAALQIQASRADDFKGWLNRAIERGQRAHEALVAVEAVH